VRSAPCATQALPAKLQADTPEPPCTSDNYSRGEPPWESGQSRLAAGNQPNPRGMPDRANVAGITEMAAATSQRKSSAPLARPKPQNFSNAHRDMSHPFWRLSGAARISLVCVRKNGYGGRWSCGGPNLTGRINRLRRRRSFPAVEVRTRTAIAVQGPSSFHRNSTAALRGQLGDVCPPHRESRRKKCAAAAYSQGNGGLHTRATRGPCINLGSVMVGERGRPRVEMHPVLKDQT